MIIGEVADPRFGTLLKGKGNYKPPKSDPVRHPNLLQYTQIKHNLVEPSFERQIQHQKHHRPPKLNWVEHQLSNRIHKSDRSPQ